LTAFFLYCEQNRPAIVQELGDGAKAKGAVIKLVAERWKAASDDVKAPLEQKAAALKAEYDKALEAFKAGGGEIQRKERKGKEEQKPKKDVNAPKRPAGGAYGIYLNENRAEIVKSLPADHKMVDVAKAAGVKWKELSEAAKQPYETKYQAKMAEYKTAVETYKAAGGGAVEDDVVEESSPEKVTPKKRKRGALARFEADEISPPAKRGKGAGRGAKKSDAPEPAIDSAVLVEAEKLGYASQLRNLAARSEITALSLPSAKVLQALQESNGLVNLAKRALLGA